MVAGDIGMAQQLTLQQQIFIVEQWLKHNRNPTATAAAFAQEFPNDVPPSRQSMHALAKKFHNTGSVTVLRAPTSFLVSSVSVSVSEIKDTDTDTELTKEVGTLRM